MLHTVLPWYVLNIITFGTVIGNTLIFFATLYFFALRSVSKYIGKDPVTRKKLHNKSVEKVKPITLGWIVYCFVTAVAFFIFFSIGLAIIVFIASICITFVSAFLITLFTTRYDKK